MRNRQQFLQVQILEFALFLDDLYDVVVVHDVGEADPLWIVLGTCPPYKGILELIGQGSVNNMTNVLHCAASAQYQPIVKVRTLSAFLCVDPNQGEILPELIKQVLQIQFHPTADYNAVRLPGKAIHFLHGNLIYLVVHV